MLSIKHHCTVQGMTGSCHELYVDSGQSELMDCGLFQSSGRHPLSFEQVTTINDHATHLQTVSYLQRQTRPAIVSAASGMCAGGVLNRH